MNPDHYFNLWDIFANELIGDVWLTIIVGLIIVYLFSAKFNFTFQVSILISLLYLSVISAILIDNVLIWGFVVLAAGTLFYFAISSKLRKG